MSNSKAITSGLIPELYKLIIVAVCSTLPVKFNHHLLSTLLIIIIIFNNSKYLLNNFNNHINNYFCIDKYEKIFFL